MKRILFSLLTTIISLYTFGQKRLRDYEVESLPKNKVYFYSEEYAISKKKFEHLVKFHSERVVLHKIINSGE